MFTLIFAFLLANALRLSLAADTCTWPAISIPANPTPKTYPCVPFTQGREIFGANLSVWAAEEIPFGSIYPQLVLDSTSKAMSLYSTFYQSTRIGVVWVYIVDQITGETGFTDGQAISMKDGSCIVEILGGADDLSFTNTMAHELYHCVQYHIGLGGQVGEKETARWWVEGSATYFSYAVYPESEVAITYDPEMTLLENEYDAALFFQFLRNTGWSDRGIHQWVSEQKFTTSASDEYARMSADPSIASVFYAFAARFIDNGIHSNTGHDIYTTKTMLQPSFFDITADFSFNVGDKYTKVLQVRPWIVHEPHQNYLYTRVKEDETVSVGFVVSDKGDPEAVLQFRRLGSQEWKILPRGETIVLQKPTDSACLPPDSPSPSEWEFLMTSTADSKLAGFSGLMEGLLEFVVKEPKDDAKPKNSCEPSDECLVGDWALAVDLVGAEAALEEQMQQAGADVTISGLTASGTASFSVTEKMNATLIMEDILIQYEGSMLGTAFSADVRISGSIVGPIVLTQGGSAFLFQEPVLSGTARGTVTVFGIPIDQGFDLSNLFGTTAKVEYVCGGNSLSLAGVVGGRTVWAYSGTRT